MKTLYYTIFTKCTLFFCHLSSQTGGEGTNQCSLIMPVIQKSISDLGVSDSAPLYLQKLLDILNALLSCYADDVIQRFHVDQHLHGLSDQVPDGR